MSQAAKAQEPSMEEILASIRRIISDDDAAKPAPPVAAPAAAAPKAPEPVKPPVLAAPRPAPAPAPAPAPMRPAAPPVRPSAKQDDIDAMLAKYDAPAAPQPAAKPENDVLDLTEAMTAAPRPMTPPPALGPAPSAQAGAAPSFRTIDGQSDVFFAERSAEKPVEPAMRATMDEARRQFASATPDRSLLSNAASSAVDSAFNSLANTVLVQNARTLEDLVKEMLRPMLKAWLDDNLPNLVERIVRGEIERVSRGRGAA